MANIVLTGFEFRVQTELTRVLDRLHHQVFISTNNIPTTADVVFCSGDDESSPTMLREIRALRPEIPVVIVTRLPNMGKWLDALEAGAADYCSAPFETVHVQWLLAGVLRHDAVSRDTGDSPTAVDENASPRADAGHKLATTGGGAQ